MKRKIKIVVIILLLLATILGLGSFFYFHITTDIKNAYAAEWVGGLIITYMKDNNGKWPNCWEDLKEPYEKHIEIVGQPWSFKFLQERVEVDWNADPNELVKAKLKNDEPPFKVIHLKNDKNTHWSGYEPNRMILEYLLNKQSNL